MDLQKEFALLPGEDGILSILELGSNFGLYSVEVSTRAHKLSNEFCQGSSDMPVATGGKAERSASPRVLYVVRDVCP
jgi:hypothetical protein